MPACATGRIGCLTACLTACLPSHVTLRPAHRFTAVQAWYTEEDVRLGAVLDLHGRRFRLVGADAFTEQYLASNGANGGSA
jgi:hypothetical protein